MILLAGISMIIVFGMPYIMDNSKTPALARSISPTSLNLDHHANLTSPSGSRDACRVRDPPEGSSHRRSCESITKLRCGRVVGREVDKWDEYAERE